MNKEEKRLNGLSEDMLEDAAMFIKDEENTKARNSFSAGLFLQNQVIIKLLDRIVDVLEDWD